MNPLVSTGLDPHRGATALSVNLNKVALVRNTRPLGIPSVVKMASIALDAGAHGITLHPRPDERHVRPHDVHDIAALLRASYPHAELNLEGNPFHNLMDYLRALRPAQATFVPDSVEQATSDHGWRFPEDATRLEPLVAAARALGVRVTFSCEARQRLLASTRLPPGGRIDTGTVDEELARHGSSWRAQPDLD